MSGAENSPNVGITYRQQYRRCGKATCSRCADGGHGHGPYWYAFWWEGGRTRSRYLGKHAPANVAGAPAPSAATTGQDSAPAAVDVAPLRVQTLGGFAVWRGEEPIPSSAWASRRVASLVKCLLSAPGHRLRREEAAELLWPEAEPDASARNLRTTIHRLRRVLDGSAAPGTPTGYLRAEGDALVLAPAGDRPPDETWLDATTFEQAARAALAGQDAAACRAALTRYGGDYLPDDPYDTWAAPLRDALRRRYLDLLLHLAALCGARGAWEEAEDLLRRALAAEPGHEDAAASLMGLLAAAGRRGEALRVYQALATALEDELDVAPTAEIVALRAHLVAQDAAPTAVQAPPRRVHPANLTNLPAPPSSFVGRAWEVTEIGNMLATARLVTLTGPGGCGKTRLALEVAATLVEAYPDGVWLVELAALADPRLAPRAVAAALGVGDQAGRPLLAALGEFLRPRRLLLVLDNCEHLIAACAELAAALLAACPHLRLLATSRERLDAAGEYTYLVPSLAAPDPAHLPPLEQLATYEAVHLFLARAQARRPEVTLTAANAEAVASICARLDGLPLAIELAAARVGVLPLEGIAARLDDRFRLLTGGPRTMLPRQQTLRATIDWSYELLRPEEQLVLQRVAVFAGGWTLDAAEGVCAGQEVADGTVLDLLGGLIDKSLAHMGAADGMGRYRLLETVRAYARERLAASGADEQVVRRHAAYYLALAEEAEPALWGTQQAAWFRRLDAEQDNLRAALEWALTHDEAVLALRMAGALWRFWIWHGDYGAWRHLIEAGLARGMAVPAAVRAKALWAAGWLAQHQGDYESAAALNRENLRLSRQGSDPLAVRHALTGLGMAAGGCGRSADAIPLFQEAVDISRALGETQFLAPSLFNLGLARAEVGERARARAIIEEALAIFREQGEKYIAATAARRVGHLVLGEGECARATVLFQESLRVSRETGHRQGLAESLEGVAAARGAAGQAEAAARLFAAAGALRDAIDLPLSPSDRADLAPYLAAARARLDGAAWDIAWEEGRAMSPEHAVAEALTW